LLKIGKITVRAIIKTILHDRSGEKQVNRRDFSQLF
jgi:hypothetical protein